MRDYKYDSWNVCIEEGKGWGERWTHIDGHEWWPITTDCPIYNAKDSQIGDTLIDLLEAPLALPFYVNNSNFFNVF